MKGRSDTTAAHAGATRAGFSLIEGLIAVSIGLLLLSITVRAMAPVRQASAVRSADHVVRTLMSRARAEAIERGDIVELRFDPSGDSAWVQAGSTQVDRFDFHDELGINVTAYGPVTVCMTPRGVADANCNQPTIPLIGLSLGGSYTSLKILPSGQIVAP